MQWGRRHLAAAAPVAGGNRRPLPAAGPRCRRPNAQGAGAEAPPKSAFPCMSWGAVTGASPKGGFLAPGKLRTSQRTRHSLRKCWGFFWAYRAILGGSTVCPQGVRLGHPCGAPLGCGSLSAHFGGPELGGSSTTYTGSERAMPRQPKSSHTVVALVSYKQTPDSWVEKHIPVSPPEESSLAHPSLRLIPLTHCAAAVNSCPRRL